eukprot:COSAG02_NODE_5447_length_4314_cov_27.423488_1_plen_165_part_00
MCAQSTVGCDVVAEGEGGWWRDLESRLARLEYDMEYDTQLRLLLLGDGGAGKSSLLTRFTDDTFVPTTSTVGVDFRTKLITLMWQRVRLQLWDTNGQERFRSITRSYYRGAHGVALVFDTCDTISFGNVSRWVADIRQHKTVEDIVIIICANKVRHHPSSARRY